MSDYVAAAPLGLEAVLKLARVHGATHVRMPDGLEVRIGPQAAAEPAGPAPANPDACPCGHSLAIEHNGAGCLRGCDHGACLKAPADE